MIVIDTHIWLWWTLDPEKLSDIQQEHLHRGEEFGIGVCAISCWEVAKLVQSGRIALPVSTQEWFDEALVSPGVRLLELTPQIAIASTVLPGEFHRDPADQIIVATARIYQCPLLTNDAKIRAYHYVQTV